MFHCMQCSNKTDFRRKAYGTCSYTEEELLDENGDVYDSNDLEYDHYNSDDHSDTFCSCCGSDDVFNGSEEEWNNWNGPLPPKPDAKNWKQLIKRK